MNKNMAILIRMQLVSLKKMLPTKLQSIPKIKRVRNQQSNQQLMIKIKKPIQMQLMEKIQKLPLLLLIHLHQVSPQVMIKLIIN